MKTIKGSVEYIKFIKKEKYYKLLVVFLQLLLLVAFFAVWEVAANRGWIDPFIFSSPARMYNMFINMVTDGNIFRHIWSTSFAVMVSFLLGTILGVLVSVILWLSKILTDVLNPYLVVFNAMPKTALAPIIIVWFGNNMRAIVVVALLISIVVTILNVSSGFLQVEKDKIKLIESFNGNRFQILAKVIIPASFGSILNALKVSVGLSFVGVIVGEFLVAREGLGFLIVHGSQIFRMDMVMLSIIILCVLAWLFYQLVAILEKKLKKYL